MEIMPPHPGFVHNKRLCLRFQIGTPLNHTSLRLVQLRLRAAEMLPVFFPEHGVAERLFSAPVRAAIRQPRSRFGSLHQFHIVVEHKLGLRNPPIAILRRSSGSRYGFLLVLFGVLAHLACKGATLSNYAL